MRPKEIISMYADTDTLEEKREFLRVDHEAQLNFKVLRGEKFASKSDISSRNVSASGLLFRTPSETSIPSLSSTIWVELDPKMINICSEIEGDLLMHNSGVFGRVVRIAEGAPGLSYDVGVCFLKKNDMARDEIETLKASA